MAKQLTAQTESLDDVTDRLMGVSGTVRQPGKGVWPGRYTVVGADGDEDDGYTLRLESVERLRRAIQPDLVRLIPGRVEETSLPASVVPHCPLRWFRPDVPPAEKA